MASALLCSFASNTLFYSSSAICTISNIVGVFFTHDLFKEMGIESNIKKATKAPTVNNKKIIIASRVAIIITICIQMLVSCYFMQEFLALEDNYTHKATRGPLQGMYFEEEAHNIYENCLKALDYIKENTNTNDPFLIVGNLNWTYMHTERPFGTYSAYYLGLETKNLVEYYNNNPDKIPKYICALTVETPEYRRTAEEMIEEERDKLDLMFDYTEERFNDSIILKVTSYKEPLITE